MILKILSWSLIVCVATMAFCCQDNQPQPGSENQVRCAAGETPSWIEPLIAEIEANGYQGEIKRYTYNFNYVFMVTSCLNCTDYITLVYTCQKEIICTFGGFAGSNTCPDFNQKATNEKLIWSN